METGLEFDVSEQQEITHGDPNLGHNRVFGGSQEGFDLKMLLDPLKEEFNLPAGFVDLSNRPGGKSKVVGEETIRGLGLMIVEPDQTQRQLILLFGQRACQLNGLIKQQAFF